MNPPVDAGVQDRDLRFFQVNVNVTALIFAVLFTFFSVKLLSLLPEKYYFTFSRVVSSSATSSFIVEAPGISLGKYCELLTSKGYLKDAKYEYDENGDVCNIVLPSSSPLLNNPAEDTQTDEPQDDEKSEESDTAPSLNKATEDTQADKAQANENSEETDTSPPLNKATEDTQKDKTQDTENSEETDNSSVNAEAGTETVNADNVLSAEQKKDLNATIHKAGQFNIWAAILLKMAPALVVGFVSYLLWKDDALLSAPIGAALVAFILCWPIITLWEVVVDVDFSDQRNLFFGLYACYIAMYYSLARFGAIIARVTRDSKLVKTEGFEIDFGKILSTFAAASITSFLTFILTQTLAAAK